MTTGHHRRPHSSGWLAGTCGALVLAAAACGIDAAPTDDIPACEEELGGLEVAVAGCHRLLALDVPAAGMEDLAAACFEQLARSHEAISRPECVMQARDMAGQVATAVMTKATTATIVDEPVSIDHAQAPSSHGFAVVPQLIDENDPRFAEIRRRLRILNNWLAFRLDLGLPIEELPSRLSVIWRDAYAIPRPQPPATPPGPEDVLHLLDVVDQFLLRNGLEDATYLPLMRLNIEAIALARVAEEVEARADLVQALCRLGDCSIGIAVRDVAQAIVALRDDEVPLPTGAALGQRASTWIDVLTEAHPQRARLQSALDALPDDAHAKLLETLVGRLRFQLQRLETAPRERFGLATRLHDENRQAIGDAFTDVRRELNDSIGLFNSARLQYAQSQIAALGQQASELGLGNELVRALDVLADSETRAAGLRRLHDQSERRWAALGDFVTRVERLGLRGEVVLSPVDTRTVELPTAAMYSADEGQATPGNIPANSVHSWSMQEGDTLRFTVSNRWSPICALQAADVHANELLQGIDTSYAEIGPEGYYLQYSQSSFDARSASETTSDITAAGVCRATASAAASVVGAIGATSLDQVAKVGDEANDSITLAFWGGIGDFFSDLGGLLGDCAAGILGGGSSGGNSETEGDESRHTAAFSGGIRLPNTPFPMLPAGSLVLALVADNAIVNTYVVNASAAIQMPSTGTAYLLVNDVNCAQSSGMLQVDWVHGENRGVRAKQLAEAMAQIATDARSAMDSIASTGQFTAADADEFRTGAWQTLFESCSNCDIDEVFPPAVLGMFEEWIAHEVAQLQRRVDLRRLTFETRLQINLLETLSGQLALEQAGGRWAEYIKQLAFTELSDTSLKRLENAVEATAEFLDQRIIPILEVRYPEVLVETHQMSVGAVGDLDLGIDQVATEFNSFVIHLDQELARASTGARGEDTTPVLLWFPKPGAPREFEDGNHSIPVMVADEDDIANLWQVNPDGTIALADNARMRIAMHELYSPDAGVADRLACGRTAPIIQGMILYAVDENSNFGGQPLNDPLNVNRFSVSVSLANPLFVTDNGTQAYDLVEGNAGELRVAGGTFRDRTTVANAFMPLETSLRGLSPFLDIQLQPIGSLNSRLTPASGLALLVSVSSYTADSGASHCD
jgi:hypothetical protein